jgi:hypothetical protein
LSDNLQSENSFSVHSSDNAEINEMKPSQFGRNHGRAARVICTFLLRSARVSVCLLTSVLAVAAQPQSTPLTQIQQKVRLDNTLIAQRVATLKEVRDVFRATAASPLPRELSAEEASKAKSYLSWLLNWAGRLDALAAEGAGITGGAAGGVGNAAGGGSQDQLLAATKNMQETQMSFNLQYLQLQSQMQNENRQFTMVSNIMKTKHDTVKNSISNIR